MFKSSKKNDEQDVLFKEPSKEDQKKERLKERNARRKETAKVIGENLATFALLAIIVIMIGTIWTEARIFTNVTKFIGDSVVTVTLYILADVCSAYIGAKNGKLDDDYIKCHNEYLTLREKVRQAGITMMNIFCDWQIDVEYEFYIRKRCKELKIDYNEYMSCYWGKSLEELNQMFPMESVRDEGIKGKLFGGIKGKLFGGIKNAKTSTRAAKIFSLNQIEHIELTPDILMTDGSVKTRRGGVGIGAEEYIKKHTVGWSHILITAIFAVVAAVPVFSLVEEFSLAMILYTVFKVALLLFRMHSGHTRGTKGYGTIEPKHLQDKIKYLYMYLEFLDKRTYESLSDKYTLIGEDDDKAGRQTQIDENRAGGDS